MATVARPDAVFDVSTDPGRKQWDPLRRVLDLNPDRREQTKKHRPAVVVPVAFAWHLDANEGFYIKARDIGAAWKSMRQKLGWTGQEGELGIKLIRRSVAQLVRSKIGVSDTVELQLQLGHKRDTSITDLYASFEPEYLRSIESAISELIEEVELLAPGAFHRTWTGETTEIAAAR